jgi:hypothetical protein
VRARCVVIAASLLLGLGGAALWAGSRLAQEPDVPVAEGSAEDGARAQQKIFDLIRGEAPNARGRSHEVVLTEAEISSFLSKNLVEAAGMPVTVRAVRLAGDGVVEFKGALPPRELLSGVLGASLVPSPWLDRRCWLHLEAKASLELGTGRRQRRYLRLDVQRFAIGRQRLPGTLLRLLAGPRVQELLRWRMPESVEGLTINPGTLVIKTSS